MSNLVLFEESPEAMAILASGKALTVEFIFDDKGPYKDYRDHYYSVLDLPNDPRIKVPMICTVLSEIGNMPGHYVIVGGKGKIVTGLHGDQFYVDLDELKEIE